MKRKGWTTREDGSLEIETVAGSAELVDDGIGYRLTIWYGDSGIRSDRAYAYRVGAFEDASLFAEHVLGLRGE